ncbi:MAG: hypothetical protein H6896_00840 [Rhodovulum sp.]|nr:hypothetical protein [Rhodovulum sp.]
MTRNAVIGKVHRLGLSNRGGNGDQEEASGAPAEPAVAAPVAEPVAAAALETGRGGRGGELPRWCASSRRSTARACRAAHAAAALGLGDQRRGAGQSGRVAKKPRKLTLMQTTMTCKWAGGRSRDRGILVLHACPPGSPIARRMCGGLPADVGAARPTRRRALIIQRVAFAPR